MRHLYLVLALICAALAAFCCFKWQGVEAEKAAHLNEVVRLSADADRQYAQNARLRAALEAAGYEIPTDLQPTLPSGEIIASN